MNPRLRIAGRSLALVSALGILIAALFDDISGLLIQPDVNMPGNPRAVGTIPDVILDGMFDGASNDELRFFVVQFKRNLNNEEIDTFERRLFIDLDGPIPEHAYIFSIRADAGRWKTVSDGLLTGSPPARGFLYFKPENRLSGEFNDFTVDDGPFPDYARRPAPPPTDPAAAPVSVRFGAVFVRFFSDVPEATQRAILQGVAAAQPWQGTPGPLLRSATGAWSVIVSEPGLESLSNQSEVRFIEPTTPRAIGDMDQARIEIGIQPLDYDGADTLIAQWDACQAIDDHPDTVGRVTPAGEIPFWCRQWLYQDLNDNNHYEIDEPILSRINYGGSIVERLLHGVLSDANPPVDWDPVPVLEIADYGRLYADSEEGNAGIVDLNKDIWFDVIENQDMLVPKVETDGDWEDQELVDYVFAWHPTLVSGIMAGDGTTQAVLTAANTPPEFVGVLPAAGVRSYKWGDASTTTEYPNAILSGARIVNNSFGFPGDYHFELQFEPYDLTTYHYDMVSSGRLDDGSPSGLAARLLVVGSSGNNGDPEWNGSRFWRTARISNSAKNVIMVGNVSSAHHDDPATGLGVPSHDSGRGPTRDGRLAPILVAPGDQLKCPDDDPDAGCPADFDQGITSTMPPAHPDDPDPDFYGASRGTSFSSPLVSGAAASLWHYYEESCGAEPLPQELRGLLVHTAKDLTDAGNLQEISAATKLVGPDFVFGYGLVRAGKAVDAIQNTVTDEIDQGWVEHRVFLGSKDQLAEHPGGKHLKVTLVWDDPPYYHDQDPRALSGVLQNDLDLEVLDANGRRYLPWILDATPGNEGDPATRATRASLQYVSRGYRDHRNTIEQVVADVPPELMNSTWTVRVRGFALLRGPQQYTLVSELFQSAEGVACGDLANGDTTRIFNPYDLPDTQLAWFLFWLAVIILIWLTCETILWLIETNQNATNQVWVYLAAFALLILLFAVFRLLHVQEIVALGVLILFALSYVFWRLVR